MDGTKGFVSGEVEWVTTLIGIAYKGKSIAGVMVQPFGPKLTLWGVIGVGSFGYKVQEVASPERRIIVSSQHHSSKSLEEYIAKLNPTKVVSVSGAGGKCLYVLLGFADAYVYPQLGTKKWDTCGPEAIVRAAGGFCTDKYGKDIFYGEDNRQGDLKYQNENGVVVSLRNHESYIAK